MDVQPIRVYHDPCHPSTPFVADWLALGGAPPIGFGNTPEAALGNLFRCLLAEEPREKWIQRALARLPAGASVKIELQEGKKWDKIKGPKR